VDIVLLGAPGAGKGTQAQLLADWLGVPAVSSGELFRAAMEANTPLGNQARGYIERGVYVPDDITVQMIAERLRQPDCAGGVILDGFPRTEAQAEALARLLGEMGRAVDLVALIGVPTDVLVERLSGRWSCPRCGAIYHETLSPPRVAGVCDVCGGTLQRRGDDAPEVQERRIEVYLEQTAPLIAYYRERGLLVEIDGDQPIDAVQGALREAVRRAEGASRGGLA
jgi:adenylate kinase